MSDETARILIMVAIGAISIWAVKDMDFNERGNRIFAKCAIAFAIFRGLAFFILDVFIIAPQ